MLFKKMLRTLFHYKAQVISMIIMIALGVGVFIGFSGEWYSIEKDTFSFYDSTGFADYRLIDKKGYSSSDLAKVLSIEGIDKASRYNAIIMNEERENDIISVSVTSDKAVSSFMAIDGEEYDENSLDGIWISDLYALNNNYQIGDFITLKYGDVTLNGSIKGLIKSSEYLICVLDDNQLMPDYKTYGYAFISPKKMIDVLGFEYYTQIHIISDLSKEEISKAIDTKLSKTNLILTKDDIVSYSEAQGEASEGKTMTAILPVIFFGIAALTMITTMQRVTIKEKTQIGTLKALGFKDKKIALHYMMFGLFIGIVGSIIGIGLGYFIAWFIFNPNGSMGTYFDLPSWRIYIPWWSFAIVFAIVAILTLISYLSTTKMLKGSANEALMPYVEKNMKRLKIEDSNRWRKLKFATKWNLRDLFRHKARTFMSLFGVFGCTVLLVASFLSMDSMLGFVNRFYYDSMNYETRISLKDDIDNVKASQIATYYKGDYMASVNVSLNDNAIPMDIYNVSNNYVRFLDKKMDYASLSDDGIYVGQRIIEENNLHIGDAIEVYLFGTNIKYELTLKGELRTLTKGIVMSEEYAKSKGIEYKISQIFTKEQMNDIANDKIYANDIASLKSRSDIIKSFDSFMEVMYTMIGALIVLSIILGIVVLYNLGTMSYFERYRELSTLKVVGFKDRQLAKLLISQNMWITILGIIIGYPIGYFVTKGLFIALASEYEMLIITGWMTIVIPALLTLSVSLFVSFLVARKSRKIDMVEALKVPE